MTASKNDISLINLLNLKFNSANCLSKSPRLKQVSKVSVRWDSQEYLLGKVSAYNYRKTCGRVYFQSSMFLTYSFKHL